MFVYLFIFTALVAQALSYEVISSETGCQEGWRRYQGGNSCLKAWSVKMPFNEARIVCHSAGSELVKIDSADKNTLVGGLVQNDVGFWIGVVDKDHAQKWTYIDGSPLTYDNWMEGSRKNLMSNQFCGNMWSGNTWKDEDCSKLYPFVCEKPSDSAPVTTTVAPDVEVVTISTSKCPQGWAVFQDTSCIKAALSLQLSYYDARSVCLNVGGDLVKIDSRAKNTFVRGLVSDEKMWIGLVDKNHDGTWTYIDGSPLSFVSWMKGQPNNYKKKQACGNLWKKLGWNDINCSTNYSFVCEIPAGSPAGNHVPDLEVHWIVHAFTSDIKRADTDDSVFIQLIGSRGKSRIIKLNTPADNFERGRLDTFQITTGNIGILTKITVTAARGGDGWHLNKMELALTADVKTGSWIQRVFQCDCWIDGDDRKTTSVKTLSITSHNTKSRWNVIVYTSDKRHAGTDDEVFIQVNGAHLTSAPMELDRPSVDDFEAGHTDSFAIVTDLLGTPSGIVVWAGKGGDAWHLRKIELQMDTPSGSSTTYVFPCDCWFDADHPRDTPPVQYIPRTSDAQKY